MIRKSGGNYFCFTCCLCTPALWGFMVKIPVLTGECNSLYAICFSCSLCGLPCRPVFAHFSILCRRFCPKTWLMTIITPLNLPRPGLWILGIVTGTIWANYQWGKPWAWSKTKRTAIVLLIYIAYFLYFEGSMNDLDKDPASVRFTTYSLCNAFSNHMDSTEAYRTLHPGRARRWGEVTVLKRHVIEMEMVFLPAIIGWILLSLLDHVFKNQITYYNRTET